MLIVVDCITVLGIGLWVLSTVAEALFGMPPWMRRGLEKRRLRISTASEARLAASAEFLQRLNAGEPLTRDDYDEIYNRYLRKTFVMITSGR